MTWRFFCHVVLEFDRIRTRIWRRKKKKKIWRNWRRKEDEEKNPQRSGKRRTEEPTGIERIEEPTEEEELTEESTRIERTKELMEEEEEQVNTRNRVLNTWFPHGFLPSHATRVLETRVPPLNLSFRVSRC